MLTISTASFGGEFWADRLGGGSDDAIVEQVLESQPYKDLSTIDVVQPEVGTGSEWVYTIKVDSEATVNFIDNDVDLTEVAVSNDNSQQPTLTTLDETPNGQRPASPDDQSLVSQSPEGIRIGPGEWTITAPQTGVKRSLKNVDGNSDASGEPVAVVDLGESDNSLAVSINEKTTRRGVTVTITARVTENSQAEESNEVIVPGATKPISDTSAYAIINKPDGSTRRVRLRDSGKTNRHGDDQQGDYIYSAKFRLRKAGVHEIAVTLDGSVNELPFRRTISVHSILSGNRLKAVSNNIEATVGEVLGEPLEEGRFGLPVKVRVKNGAMPDYLETRAEVWAKDSEGNYAVVGWIGGMVEPVKINGRRWHIPFTFHNGWLQQDDYQAPLSLRNIRINDIDTGDQIVFNDKTIGISGVSFPAVDAHSVSDIQSALNTNTPYKLAVPSPRSFAMQKGVHPSQLGAISSARPQLRSRFDNNPDVVVLHGWCDGQKRADHFSDAVSDKALPYGGSTHGDSADRYALKVMKWLNWNPGKIRGIIAHSHGGLAAATLLDKYSYVFTDGVQSRPPNVVSMGSPYYGTSLLNHVGNNSFVKLVAQVGQGCINIPSELFPSRNRQWSNRIGWRAKLQINSWYTTHTRSRWYDKRDCSVGSYFISGHDDGVISPKDGHYFADGGAYSWWRSGYCHTKGLGQKDQWYYPGFVQKVNDLFSSRTEAWRPF